MIGRSWVLALTVIVTGFLLRLPALSVAPLDCHPTRQFRSAIIARAYAVDSLNLTEPARAAATAAAHAMPPIEPPIMEHLAAAAYRIVGREDLARARLLAVISWTLGGVSMWWLSVQLLSPAAALGALAVWTSLPFAIRASRSFQPDPLMVALVVLTLALAISAARSRRVCRDRRSGERFAKSGDWCIGASGGSFTDSPFGFSRGFVRYRDSGVWKNAADVTDWAIERVNEAPDDAPLLLFLNSFNAHEPNTGISVAEWRAMDSRCV